MDSQIKKLLKTIRLEGLNNKEAIYKVGDYQVVEKKLNGYSIRFCSCHSGTMHPNSPSICKHKDALVIWKQIYSKELEEQKNKIANSLLSYSDIKKSEKGLTKLNNNQGKVLRQLVEFTCQHCGKHEDEVGKIEPHRIKRGIDGGKYVPNNIQMLCNKCHKQRAYDY